MTLAVFHRTFFLLCAHSTHSLHSVFSTTYLSRCAFRFLRCTPLEYFSWYQPNTPRTLPRSIHAFLPTDRSSFRVDLIRPCACGSSVLFGVLPSKLVPIGRPLSTLLQSPCVRGIRCQVALLGWPFPFPRRFVFSA